MIEPEDGFLRSPRLSIREISEGTGLSRAQIKRAMRILERQGGIVPVRQKGKAAYFRIPLKNPFEGD